MLVETVPPWLATMRRIDGTYEAPGDADNPVILAWSDTIARTFPEMASYARLYTHDETAWCGLCVAHCMAANGIRPPYAPRDELKSYLWVDGWARWGTLVPAGQERRGDVLVFSSPHHVTLYEGEEGGYYLGHGGNQDDRVKISRYRKSGIRAIRRSPLPTALDESRSEVPSGSSSPGFHSLIGGFYSSTPMDRSSGPVAIRMNNPGAINSVPWVRAYPGYVSDVETTPGNKTALFETPEQGVAAWHQLMTRYRSRGATTIRKIINEYGGGQDYSDYVANVVARTGLSADHEIALEGDDSTLLKFAKAMFRHEAGRESPLSDNQILHGFKFARDYARTGRVPAPIGPSDLQSKADNSLLLMPLLMMFLKEKRMADDPAKPQQSVDIENVLLPMLLQSALTGKLIDVTELLSVVLTGKPSALAANTPTPWREPWSVAPQQPTDINALLLPLLYQVLTGKPWPGATPPREPEQPEKKPKTPGTSAMSRPSVQLGVAGFALSTILQALGIVGTPFGMGQSPTEPGTLATLLPIATAAIGATGGFGALASIGLRLLSGFKRQPT